MAYFTGSVNSSAQLATLLKNTAAANGWSLTGDVVSKNGAHIRITAPDTSEVRIEGARNGNFVAPDICPRYSRIRLTNWPSSATYHLIVFENPDTVWCTINFDTITYMHIGFGVLQKYAAWDGGMWYHAQHTTGVSDLQGYSYVDGDIRSYYANSGNECALFWNQRDYHIWGGANNNKVSMLHCELRGEVWPGFEQGTGVNNDFNMIHCPSIIRPTHKCNPNTFNGQTVLSPFMLSLQNTDGHYMPVGHVGHLRWVKLTNYNPGDIIQLGTEKWLLFPWKQFDITRPDGTNDTRYSLSTGVNGIALAYDGP